MVWIPYLVLAAILVVFLRAVVPRRVVVRQDDTRLLIASPLLARLLEDLRLLAWGTMTAVLLVAFGMLREWILMAICAIILLRIGWQVYRKATRATLIVDPRADTIQLGPRVVGRVSELVALQVSPSEPSSVVLVLRDGSRQDRGVLVQGADPADGDTISTTLASHLRVPIMESS